MIFEIAKQVAINHIGFIESERDTSLDFTNYNDVKFDILVSTKFDEFSIRCIIGFDRIVHGEYFYKQKEPKSITIQGIIDAVVAMADFVDENRNIDQYDLIELKNRHHDNS